MIQDKTTQVLSEMIVKHIKNAGPSDYNTIALHAIEATTFDYDNVEDFKEFKNAFYYLLSERRIQSTSDFNDSGYLYELA